MKLFLASLASQSLDLVRPLLSDDPTKLKLAFIPTAADPYPRDGRPWLVDDFAKFSQLGFMVTEYSLNGKNEQTLMDELSQFDVIYVAGGNTYYLLYKVRETRFDKVIKKLIANGKVYIGSSAGACIMCPTIEHIEFLDKQEMAPNLKDFTGLGYVNHLIIPHYGREKYAEGHAKTKAKWGDKITFLNDDQVVVVNNDKIKIITNKSNNE